MALEILCFMVLFNAWICSGLDSIINSDGENEVNFDRPQSVLYDQNETTSQIPQVVLPVRRNVKISFLSHAIPGRNSDASLKALPMQSEGNGYVASDTPHWEPFGSNVHIAPQVKLEQNLGAAYVPREISPTGKQLASLMPQPVQNEQNAAGTYHMSQMVPFGRYGANNQVIKQLPFGSICRWDHGPGVRGLLSPILSTVYGFGGKKFLGLFGSNSKKGCKEGTHGGLAGSQLNMPRKSWNSGASGGLLGGILGIFSEKLANGRLGGFLGR